MGPVRGGLNLSLLPVPAFASAAGPAGARACDTLRPGWDGTRVGPWAEALSLLGSPAALLLIAASLLVARFRSQWGALAVFVGWTLLVSVLTVFGPHADARRAAMEAGCVGSPAIFIAAAMTIGAALIVYTGPPPRRE